MTAIIRGTTPSLIYTFKQVNVAHIVKAYLTIKQNNVEVFEKVLAEATVGTNTLTWTFTQAETLQLRTGKITAQLNWKTDDGTRGASDKDTIPIVANDKEEVI